ncbi:MAG TPA: hypothetical protein DDY88_06805 [Actinobacteria bacterium]|nr:hypothetical protein [Actinomycetota bacterium]
MRRTQFLASAASAPLLLAIMATSATAATPPASPSASSAATSTTLQVVNHSNKVSGFTKFRYQTGKVRGINEAAAAKINKVIAENVNSTMLAAKKSKNSKCPMGLKDCGYYIQTLKAPTCQTGNVCVTAPASLLPVGANTGDSWVDTWVFDSITGATRQLQEFVSTNQEAAFLAAVNAGITAQLTKGGITNDPLWTPNVKMKDVYAWIPTPDGIHIYFSKYDVAPGSFGVVNVLVPWSAIK